VNRNLELLVKFAALDKLSAPLKKIALGSKTTSRDLAATRQQLTELGRAQDRLGSFKALQKGLTDSHAKLDATRRRMRALKEQIEATDGPAKRLRASFDAAQRSEQRLAEKTSDQVAKLKKLQGELRGAGVDTMNLAQQEARLGREVDQATAKLARHRAELDRVDARRARSEKVAAVGGKLQSLGAGSAAAGAAIGAPLVGVGKSAADFQSDMTSIAQKVNLSRTAGTALGRQLDELGPKVAQLPVDLAKGLDDLAGKGMDPRAAIAMLAPIGKAATAYKAEIADISATSFAVLDNLKVPIGQSAKALDIMAVAGKRGAFELKDMAQYFPSLTAQAQALGMKGVAGVADLAAAAQITRKATGDSAAAATNLENLLSKINTKDAIDNFKKFGVDLPAAMKKAAAEGKSPIEAIAELTNKALKGNLAKLPFLFQDMQVQSALRPLVQNLALYRQIRADALAANGEVERDFAERMGDADAKAQRLQATMQKLAHARGADLLPVTSAAMDKLSGLIERFNAFAGRNPAAAKWITIIAAGLAALLAVLGTVAIALGFMLPGLNAMWSVLSRLAAVFRVASIAIRIMGSGLMWIGRLALANPWMLLIAGIALAAYMIWKHWDTIKAAFSAALAWLQARWADFKAMGANLIEGLIGGITGKLSALKSRVVGIAESAKGWFKAALGIHSPSRVFAQLGGFVTQGLADGIDRGGRVPVDRLRRVAGAMSGALAIAMPAQSPAIAAVAARGATAAPVPMLAGARPPGPGRPPIAAAPAPLGPVEIHIHAAPGQDPQAIAREVARQIAELQRRASAKRASRYEDD
jgi:TP901 family phage tail tape measure protein